MSTYTEKVKDITISDATRDYIKAVAMFDDMIDYFQDVRAKHLDEVDNNDFCDMSLRLRDFILQEMTRVISQKMLSSEYKEI